MSLVKGLFFLVLLLNRQWSPLLRLQASHCSTFRIMCVVPSIAVFCSEPIECFLLSLVGPQQLSRHTGNVAGRMDRRSNPDPDHSLFQIVQTISGVYPILFNTYRGSFPEVKRPERAADHLPSNRAEGENKWSYTSTPLCTSKSTKNAPSVQRLATTWRSADRIPVQRNVLHPSRPTLRGPLCLFSGSRVAVVWRWPPTDI